MDALQAATRLHARTLAHGEALRGLDAVLAKLAEPIRGEPMTTEGKPSVGAMRAAKKINERVIYPNRRDTDAETAALIDRETGLAELVEALRKCAGFIAEWRDALEGVQMNEADFERLSGLREARAALSRFTGEG